MQFRLGDQNFFGAETQTKEARQKKILDLEKFLKKGFFLPLIFSSPQRYVYVYVQEEGAYMGVPKVYKLLRAWNTTKKAWSARIS